jgi:DNA-binding CsgD family transcriptional regulator
MTTIRRSEEITTQVLDLFQQGKSDKEMAAAIGVSVDAVRNHRYKLGIKRSQQTLTFDDKLTIKALKRDGLTNRAIAAQYGITANAVTRVLRHADTTTRKVTDVLKDPINKFLASRWTAETVRNCLV